MHDLTAHILEIDIDPIRGRRDQLLPPVRCLAIHCRIETQFIEQMAAFLRPTRDADGAASLQSSDLARHRTHRSGGRRNDHRFSGFRASQIQEPEVGRQSGHAARPQHRWKGYGQFRGQNSHGAGTLVGETVVLPSRHANDAITCLVPRRIRFDDHTDAPASHYLPELDGWHVLLPVAHPDPVGGIEAQVENPHERFFRSRRGDRTVDEIEVRSFDALRRPRPKPELTVDFVFHCFSPSAIHSSTRLYRNSRVQSHSCRDEEPTHTND